MKKTYPKTPKPMTKGSISVDTARKAFAKVTKTAVKPSKEVLYDTKSVRIVKAA